MSEHGEALNSAWRAFEREKARADRSEAEFCACKALLVAAQKRAERAEAERAEARDLALREAAEACENLSASPLGNGYGNFGNAFDECAQAIRALAALPVEPARPEQKEIQRDGDTPSAPTRGES